MIKINLYSELGHLYTYTLILPLIYKKYTMLNLQSPIEEIMSSDVITLTPSDSLSKVKEIFENNKIHHIPIVLSDKLEGIVSKSDYLFFLRGFSPNDKKYDNYRLKTHFVSEIMTKGVAKMEVGEKISIALAIFRENLFHAIPITSNDRLVGIVTTFDIIDALAKDKGAISEFKKAG